MKSFKYVVKDELGIHARPAGQIVKEAKNFESAITVACGAKKTVLSKGVMGVMMLGVKQGAEVEVSAEGADEDAAIEAMQAFFESNL